MRKNELNNDHHHSVAYSNGPRNHSIYDDDDDICSSFTGDKKGKKKNHCHMIEILYYELIIITVKKCVKQIQFFSLNCWGNA